MKFLRILSRQFRDACKNVFRNFSLSFASISCISITLILVGVSLILEYNVNNFSNQIEDTMTISVFIKRNTEEQRLEEIKDILNRTENITEVNYISKEEVKKDFAKDSTVLGQVISTWDDDTNPLQDEFIVSVENIELIKDTATIIQNIDDVDIVKYGEGMVENLVSTFNVIRNIMLVIVVALIVVTAFLISNTIKITINNRQREISIKRLVGASNSHIKTPFFFEGIIIGIFGSLVPIAVCAYGYVILYQKLGGKLFTPIISLVEPGGVIVDVILLILVISVVVGAFGSYRAVKRYLKI